MAKKFEVIEQQHGPMKQEIPVRADVETALLRLQKIAEKLPPVDAVAVIREGRDVSDTRER